jgi:hypothetical protein
MSANSSGFNIQQFLRGLNNKGSNTKTTTGYVSAPNTTGAVIGVATRSSFGRIISYLLAIIIVVLVILLFINFFITPIFRLRPGGPGIIPVPGFDDGKLYWNKTSPGMILNKDLPIVSQSFDYTVNLDVFIQNPLQFSIAPRVFFSRGGVQKQKPSGDTMLSVIDNYNLAAALLPDTSDLIVSVLNMNNNMENIIVPNIPVQEPFRLTMVVMQQALEVYINGKLVKTRTFLAPPKSVLGDIYPSTGIEINVTKVRNLKIWSRILSTGEIKQSTPSLSKASNFGAGAIPSSSCLSNAINDITNSVENSIDRYSKLSLDTVSDEDSKLL